VFDPHYWYAESILMVKGLTIAAGSFLALHGLAHLMGWIAYWPLGVIAGLPYKTTLFDGSWNLGDGGMRIFSVLWLIVALGFITAAVGLITGQAWTTQTLVATTLLSLAITALDWGVAFRGTLIDAAVLAAMLIVPRFPALLPV
jgi:hypothetical protein